MELRHICNSPDALPYMTSEYIMNTTRLQNSWGQITNDVIHYTIADASPTASPGKWLQLETLPSNMPVKIFLSPLANF